MSTIIKKIALSFFAFTTSSLIYASPLGSGNYYDESRISQFALSTGNVGIDHGYPLIDDYVTLKPTFNLNKPVTTGRWWTPLLAVQRDAAKVTDFLIFNPFRAVVNEKGVNVGIPTQKNFAIDHGSAGINQGNMNRGYKETLDVTVAVDNLTGSVPMVSDYSDWSVNVDWVAEQHSALKVIMTEGSPFIFFEKKKNEAAISLAFTNAFQASLLSASQGISLFKTFNNSDVTKARYYAIYTYPDHSALTWTDSQGQNIAPGNQLNSTVQLNDKNTYFTLASIPATEDGSAKTLAETMQAYAFSFITNTSVVYQYQQNQSLVQTTFNLTSKNVYPGVSGLSNQPLIMLYPWQIDHLNAAQKQNCLFGACDTQEDIIATLNGNMHLFSPSTTTQAGIYSFPLSLTFHGVLPSLPNELSPQELSGFNKYAFDLATPANQDPHLWANNAFTDTYATGKLFGAEAQLIKTADQLKASGKNYLNSRDQLLLSLQQQMNSFLTGKVQTTCPNCKLNDDAAWFFTYNSKWNTFLAFPSGFFTATTLTDHFFHYGYFLDAAATLAQFDKKWAQQYGAMINLMVRDLWDYTYDQNKSVEANLKFAHFKSFDPYAGISSALGMAWSPDSINEEDSAEFMNFAQALILWGINTEGVTFDGDAVTQSQQLRDLGLYLYTTEQEGLSYYHFNQHPESGVFPENWVNPETGQKNLIIGNVWGGKLDRSTYFCAGQKTCYYENLASNTFPMTTGSFYLGLDPDFVLSAYQDDAKSPCSTSDSDLNKSAYCATLLKYLALGDAKTAQKNFLTYFGNAKNSIDPGNTMADTEYWILNLQHLGHLNTSLLADVPTYAVFGTNDTAMAAAYNGSNAVRDIHFFTQEGQNVCVIKNVQPGELQVQLCKLRFK